MTGPAGVVIIGGVPFPSAFARELGSDFELVICAYCRDRGKHVDDDGNLTDYCDCDLGVQMAQAALLAPVERACW